MVTYCPVCKSFGYLGVDEVVDYDADSGELNAWDGNPWPSLTDCLLENESSESCSEYMAVNDIRSEAGPHVAWTQVDLSDHDLSEVDFTGAMLWGSRFGDLSGCVFHQADLSGAAIAAARESDFSGARLTDLRAAGSDMLGAVFKGAHLSRADFNGACLRGAKFEDAELDGADLRAAQLEGSTIDSAATLAGASIGAARGLTPDQLKACVAKGAVVI